MAQKIRKNAFLPTIIWARAQIMCAQSRNTGLEIGLREALGGVTVLQGYRVAGLENQGELRSGSEISNVKEGFWCYF